MPVIWTAAEAGHYLEFFILLQRYSDLTMEIIPCASVNSATYSRSLICRINFSQRQNILKCLETNVLHCPLKWALVTTHWNEWVWWQVREQDQRHVKIPYFSLMVKVIKMGKTFHSDLIWKFHVLWQILPLPQTALNKISCSKCSFLVLVNFNKSKRHLETKGASYMHNYVSVLGLK